VKTTLTERTSIIKNNLQMPSSNAVQRRYVNRNLPCLSLFESKSLMDITKGMNYRQEDMVYRIIDSQLTSHLKMVNENLTIYWSLIALMLLG